jgi:hypothetical protein
VKTLLLTFLFIYYPFGLLFSQIGGDGTYRFLDLTNSAKVAALGGTQISFHDNDLELTYYNPSLLSDTMRNQLSINYVNYIAGIGVGYVAFAPYFQGRNSFAAGIHYVNYGTFDGASENGQLTGTFGAAEYAINLFYSRTLTPHLRAGINLKPIFSSFESYHSFGLAADLGITWIAKDERSVISFVIKNMGTQVTTYYKNGDREKLPWDVQLGFLKRLAHAPIRFFATANHLNTWNLSYLNRQKEEPSTDEQPGNFTSLLLRHFIFGAEIMPEQHVTLRIGYNFQRQKELSVADHAGLVGFSAGVGVKISKFSLNYGIASFHLAATAHYFTLASNLSQFIH